VWIGVEMNGGGMEKDRVGETLPLGVEGWMCCIGGLVRIERRRAREIDRERDGKLVLRC